MYYNTQVPDILILNKKSYFILVHVYNDAILSIKYLVFVFFIKTKSAIRNENKKPTYPRNAAEKIEVIYCHRYLFCVIVRLYG